jgi:hypothetical protein
MVGCIGPRALEGRRLVAEHVTEAENARDQIAAFRVHVVRHFPEHIGSDWLALPDRQIDQKLSEMATLLERLQEILRSAQDVAERCARGCCAEVSIASSEQPLVSGTNL